MRSFLVASLFALPMFLATNAALALGVGDHAPCVVLNNIAPDGSESEHCIRQPNVEGQPKIIEFFSATCSDCMKNLPILSKLAMRTEKVATTRMVGLDKKESVIRDYVKANSKLITFEVALDMNRDAKRAYEVIEVPTTFVLDKDDKILYRHSGVLSAEDVMMIENLVGLQ